MIARQGQRRSAAGGLLGASWGWARTGRMMHLEMHCAVVFYIREQAAGREIDSPLKDSSRCLGPEHLDGMQSSCCLGQVGSGCSITRTADTRVRHCMGDLARQTSDHSCPLLSMGLMTPATGTVGGQRHPCPVQPLGSWSSSSPYPCSPPSPGCAGERWVEANTHLSVQPVRFISGLRDPHPPPCFGSPTSVADLCVCPRSQAE